MEPHTQAALLLLMHVIQILLKVKSFVVVLHISFVLFVASYGCFVLRFKQKEVFFKSMQQKMFLPNFRERFVDLKVD